MKTDIINRVQSSSLVTFDLETFYHPEIERIVFDLSEYLHMGLILRESDFRDALKSTSWTNYQQKIVAIGCSADAIIPHWAFALVGVYLSGVAHFFSYGSSMETDAHYINSQLQTISLESFRNAKVVLKGCSQFNIPMSCYVEAIRLLKPYVASIMYGEPCSTVPLFKKPKA